MGEGVGVIVDKVGSDLVMGMKEGRMQSRRGFFSIEKRACDACAPPFFPKKNRSIHPSIHPSMHLSTDVGPQMLHDIEAIPPALPAAAPGPPGPPLAPATGRAVPPAPSGGRGLRLLLPSPLPMLARAAGLCRRRRRGLREEGGVGGGGCCRRRRCRLSLIGGRPMCCCCCGGGGVS